MGMRIHYIGRKQVFRSLSDNVKATTDIFPLVDGFFGTKGTSRGVREIHSRDHEATAKKFFNLIAKGGMVDLKTIKNGVLSIMKDGSIVSYRKITGSENSPAVEIRFRKLKTKYGINDQKIHFVKD